MAAIQGIQSWDLSDQNRDRLEQVDTSPDSFARQRFQLARHSAQYFDPSAPPLTASDATWAIEKAEEAQSGVKALLSSITAGAVQLVVRHGEPEASWPIGVVSLRARSRSVTDSR